MRLAALLLLTLRATAAVLQGVVLDEETGNPLARTSVTLTPLTGKDAATVTIRTGDRGAFTILSVRPGWYLLKTSRRGFADAEAGQLRPGRPGIPFEVLDDVNSSFFQLRMRRLAAVTGSILDENNVGIPEVPVHVYTARKPVRRVAEAKTDDRGIFRVPGLDPGTYIARTGASLLEDNTGILPTYYKYGDTLRTAERFNLRLGETQTDVVIRPQKGTLLTISGVLSLPGQRLTLITDTGRRLIASGAGPFEAANVPPGAIELVAEGTDCGSYMRMLMERDLHNLRIGCNPLYNAQIDFRIRNTPRFGLQYPILARRVDLDGASAPRIFKTTEPILPGHYELIVQTGPLHYAQSVRGPFPEPVKEGGWFAMDFGNQVRLSILLSETPGAVTGSVTTAGKPVAGAVIYLEAFDPDSQEPRLQLWTSRTDYTGKYSFPGLTPGRYRLLSTFDFDPEDRFAMNAAKEVKILDGTAAVVDLDLILR